jgi:maltose O-acetyltransferase
MRERMLAGELYIADDPEIEAAARRAHLLMDASNATAADASSRRHELLTALLGGLGADTVVRPPLYIDYGSNLSLGQRCFVN